MIKKYLITTLLIFNVYILSTPSIIHGQEKTATDESTPIAIPTIDDSIKNLRDKIANKVEELTKNNKNITTGYIVKIEKGVIALKSSDDTTIKALIDESVTQFYSLLSGERKTSKLSNFAKDDFMIASGPIIDNTVNVNSLYKIQAYEVDSGKIIDIDKKDFTVNVITTEKNEYTLDIEQYTKQQKMDPQTLKINAIGFSKMKQGDTIHFSTKNQKTKDQKNIRASAVRVFIIPQEYFGLRKLIE